MQLLFSFRSHIYDMQLLVVPERWTGPGLLQTRAQSNI
jgi:hypothetical protein